MCGVAPATPRVASCERIPGPARGAHGAHPRDLVIEMDGFLEKFQAVAGVMASPTAGREANGLIARFPAKTRIVIVG